MSGVINGGRIFIIIGIQAIHTAVIGPMGIGHTINWVDINRRIWITPHWQAKIPQTNFPNRDRDHRHISGLLMEVLSVFLLPFIRP